MRLHGLILVAVAFLLAACGAGDGSDSTTGDASAADASSVTGDASAVEDTATGQLVTLRFRVSSFEQPFTCNGTLSGLGTTGGILSPADMRFYVHDVTLHSSTTLEEVPLVLEEDGKWQGSGVALLDFEDGTGTCDNGTDETHEVVTGRVPEDTYDGLRFTLGVPPDLNHLDVATAAPPLNVSGLYWGWQGGYKYLRLDGATVGDPSFRVHLGATECELLGPGDFSCGEENLATILFTGFNLEDDVIVLDLAMLLAGDDVNANSPDTPAGCMSGLTDPDCTTVFDNLGLTVASPQKAFRIGEVVP